MVLKIAKRRTVEWPVTVNVPHDGGEVRKHTFDVTFEVLKQSEMEAVTAAGEDLLQRVVTGWKRYVDDDEKPIEYGDVAKAELLDDPVVRAALYAAYGEIQRGAAARKNG